MLDGLRSEDLITMLVRVRSDGTGLTKHEAAQFLDFTKDSDLKPLVDPTIWTEAQRLAPLVREHFTQGFPAFG